MPRMKSRSVFPPHEFQLLLPELGMREALHGSFNEMVAAFMAIIAKNTVQAQRYNWPTTKEGVENFVDSYNAHRCIAAGWLTFVELDSDPSVIPEGGVRRSVFAENAAGIKRVGDGLKLITDWLGSGRKPVAPALAEQRAAICVTCPKNGGGDWKAYFTKPAADQVRYLLGVKHDMDLHTSLDDKLQICVSCDCPLGLKVWAPIDHVRNYTSDDTKARLDARCWVLRE